MMDEPQDYLRQLYEQFGRPTRWQRLRSFLRAHIPRRRKRFTYQPGMQIRMQDGSTRTIAKVQETTVRVKRGKS